MFRIVLFLILIGLLASGAAWITDQPGEVTFALGDLPRAHVSLAVFALALGIISEIQEPDRVLTRAYELAHNFATQTPSVQRYTRFVLTQPLRRAVAENLTYTLALQGMGTWARPANTVD